MKHLLHTLLLLPGVIAAPRESQAAASQPNILFLFADDWGWGNLSCHGHLYVKTPNIDRLAHACALGLRRLRCVQLFRRADAMARGRRTRVDLHRAQRETEEAVLHKRLAARTALALSHRAEIRVALPSIFGATLQRVNCLKPYFL